MVQRTIEMVSNQNAVYALYSGAMCGNAAANAV